jgi:hypothetical protein
VSASIKSVNNLGRVTTETMGLVEKAEGKVFETIKRTWSEKKAKELPAKLPTYKTAGDIALFKEQMEYKLVGLSKRNVSAFANTEIKKEYATLNKELNKLSARTNVTSNDFARFRLQTDKLGSSVKIFNNNMRSTNKAGYGFGEMFAVAAKKVLIWTAAMTVFQQTMRQFAAGVQYIMELDNALNEVRIVTGQSQMSVTELAKSYNDLAKQMGVTTIEIAKTSAELYRQGLTAEEVDERLQGIIKYAKISGITLAESNKIITATANATGRSIENITDIFALLGKQYCPAA